MATSFKYRVIATDTPNGQREVRFQRLDQRSPMLLALYGPAEMLSEYENGAERDIDPDEHAQIFESQSKVPRRPHPRHLPVRRRWVVPRRHLSTRSCLAPRLRRRSSSSSDDK
jgi:hypothetical protein